MTVSPWEIYLLLKLDDFQTTCLIAGGLGSLLLLLCFIGSLVEESTPTLTKSIFALLLCCMLLLFTAGVLLPDTKQAAVIYAAPRVLNSEFVQKDVPKEAKEIYGLARKWLEQQVEEKGKREGVEN